MALKLATCTLQSVSPYSQSRSYVHEYPRPPKVTAGDHEETTWRHKAHTDKDGHIIIPPMSFKMALDTAAKMLGQRIPGKGQSTYSKFFKSGVLCMTPVTLPDMADTVPGDRIFANSDGVRGSGKRVWRIFPRIDAWRADVTFHVLADEITADVFESHLTQAGAFVGIGRFRPENGGFYGRFAVEKIVWS